jgi:flagellar biosynthetic protein FliP
MTAALFLVLSAAGSDTLAQDLPNIPTSIGGTGEGLTGATGESALDVDRWTSPEKLSSTLQIMLMLTVLSLAPAVLIMTTCFVRIIVVLGLLRQAMGTQQLPPSQVITSIALFLTLLVMTPVWSDVYDQGIKPYTAHEVDLTTAFQQGAQPIRKFMAMQIENAGNTDDVWMFLDYMPDWEPSESENLTYEDVPLRALLPAFLLSELKTAFLIGFQIYLPFLILDVVIASVMISMGMLMLPPVLISLPFKLLLFVLVDGWQLIAGMLLDSFQVYM